MVATAGSPRSMEWPSPNIVTLLDGSSCSVVVVDDVSWWLFCRCCCCWWWGTTEAFFIFLTVVVVLGVVVIVSWWLWLWLWLLLQSEGAEEEPVGANEAVKEGIFREMLGVFSLVECMVMGVAWFWGGGGVWWVVS